MAGENVCASDFEPHFTASQDSRHEITPGLIALNLNIMQALDMNIIQDVKENISKLINKEHDIVRNVHENIIALLKMKIPREKREGRLDLESILTRSPNNLNVLADLEYVYRELHRSADADKCKQTIEKIMCSEKENDMQCIQTCLLEQGYVILIERTLFDKNTVEQRITDLTKILNTEQERSKGIRKECLGRGLHHQMQVLRNVQNANEEDAKDGHILRKGSSLQKFKRAEQMFITPFPHIVWKYYHAKALNQYYFSLEVMSRFKKGLEEEMTNVTISAVEKFWEMSQSSTDQDMERYKARSYAYIGQILIKRSNLVRSKEMEFSFLKTAAFRKYLEDPLTASKTAFNIQPNDITVLTRYGRSLWNKTKSIEDSSEKLTWLQKAETVLSKAIDNDNHNNWFALSTRMHVRLNISEIYVKTLDAENNRSANSYLHKAIEDGLKCFQSQTTQTEMTILADAYQRLAKFPNIHKFGKEYVKTPDHLHQALDYLSFATHLGAPPDYHWTRRTASCLFDLGEYDNAIEFQRKTWFLASPSTSSSFYLLCIFMITMFENTSKMPTPIDQFLREFLYSLIYAKSKYKGISHKNRHTNQLEEIFTSNIVGLLKNKRDGLLKLLEAIIVQRAITLRESEKAVLTECFQVWIKISRHPDLAALQALEIQLNELPTAIENEYLLSDLFHKPSLRPLAKSIKPCSNEFTYDFFVSHSHKDEDWVVNILLRHLESKFDDHEIVFKGCIADRDFVPGVSVIDNIIAAIKESNKVILILTKHFVSSNWCNYEASHAIIKSLDLESDESVQVELMGVNNISDCAARDLDSNDQTLNVLESENQKTNPKTKESYTRNRNRNCVIPIVLEECEIPDKIKHLNFIDMTDQKDFIEQMKRLKKALLPVENY